MMCAGLKSSRAAALQSRESNTPTHGQNAQFPHTHTHISSTINRRENIDINTRVFVCFFASGGDEGGRGGGGCVLCFCCPVQVIRNYSTVLNFFTINESLSIN